MPSPGPYVGLRPFERDEAMLFFGRREQNLELLDRLHRERFVAVVGRSGCGKSSLIRAGLIPKLEAGMLVADRDRWRVAIMTPGDHPRRALARCLTEADCGDAEALAERIEATGMAALREHLRPMLEDEDANLLLLVDQFEEIFRYGSDDDDWREEASDFVSLMIGLADQRALPVYVVLTMRSDFMWNCDAFPGLPEAMSRSLYLVPRLTAGEQREAICGPARLFGREISRRLVNRLLNDLEDQPDRLPVLQHALMRVWQGLDGDRKRIDVQDYEVVGTIREALERHAEEALEGMSDAELQATEMIFRTLTDTDPRNRRIRRPAPLSELVAVTGGDREVVLGIIERFRAGGRSFLRLSGEDADPRIDISHESLIRRWPRLRAWVDAEAEDRATYHRLLDAAERHEAGDGALWRDPELQLALVWWRGLQPGEAWAERYGSRLDLARSFLDRSREEQERARRQEQLKIRLMRRFLLALGVTALVAIGFGIYALLQRRVAETALRLAEDKQQQALNAKAEAEEQGRKADEAGESADRALKEGSLASQAAVTSYSPDRSSLVTITQAGTVTLSDAVSGEEIGVLESDSRIGAVAFSPDGRKLATCGDPDVRIWQVRPSEHLRTLMGHESRVRKAAFSPDGQLLATAGDDRTARLWNVETGELHHTFKGFDAEVIDVTFSADGREVFCWSSKGESKIWSASGLLVAEREYSSDKETARIRMAQELLKSLGYYSDTVDGIWGPLTTRAIERFQNANDLEVDGQVSEKLVEELRARAPEEIENRGFVVVRIPAGSFTMGSAEDDPRSIPNEKPAHRVKLSEFWIGKYEVTNKQYRQLHPDHEGEPELPATRVSWHDADAFCEHFGFELPTEAQWEYAARTGSEAAYSFGDDEGDLDRYAWYRENSDLVTHSVGTREANAWGLHDMHGNVWEWVADVYGPYSGKPQTNPTGPPQAPGAERVLRGGAFDFEPWDLRSAIRLNKVPETRYQSYGFRCVRR